MPVITMSMKVPLSVKIDHFCTFSTMSLNRRIFSGNVREKCTDALALVLAHVPWFAVGPHVKIFLLPLRRYILLTY